MHRHLPHLDHRSRPPWRLVMPMMLPSPVTPTTWLLIYLCCSCWGKFWLSSGNEAWLRSFVGSFGHPCFLFRPMAQHERGKALHLTVSVMYSYLCSPVSEVLVFFVVVSFRVVVLVSVIIVSLSVTQYCTVQTLTVTVLYCTAYSTHSNESCVFKMEEGRTKKPFDSEVMCRTVQYCSVQYSAVLTVSCSELYRLRGRSIVFAVRSTYLERTWKIAPPTETPYHTVAHPSSFNNNHNNNSNNSDNGTAAT